LTSACRRGATAGNGRAKARSRPAARFHLRLEVLEDRTVPSAFNVTTTLDEVDPNDGVLSLREAVIASNAAPGPDTINLPAGFYELTLRTGFTITDDLTLRGLGDRPLFPGFAPNQTTIGSENVRIPGPIFQVVGATVTFSDVVISGGAALQGGGLFNDGGNVTLVGCGLVGSQTNQGGGLFSAGGNVTFVDSAIGGNFACQGGGIYVAAGTVTLRNSQIVTNESGQGGGIYVAGGAVTMTNSLIAGNVANSWFCGPGAEGGGIYVANGSLSINNCTLESNLAESSSDALGGAIYVAGGSVAIEHHNSFRANQALGFSPSSAGIGGAVYIAGGSVCLANNTTFSGDFASTSNPDIFGPYTLC
jgi:hypothetical protein